MYKTHHGRTTFGSYDVEKVHDVVARSTFWSQNVQSTPWSDHFWKLRCRKSARRCGAKHISKSKCTKHHMFAPLLESEMSSFEKVHAVMARSTFPSQNTQNTPCSDHFWSLKCRVLKKCTPLWREAQFQVKMYTTLHVRATFGGSDIEKVHAVVARSTFPSQNVQNATCSRHFWRFRCRFTTLHYTPLHYAPLHYTTQHYNYTTTLHYTKLHYTTLHYTTLHYTTLHYTALPSTTLNYITLHSTTLQLHNYTPLQYTPLRSTTLNYTTLHYITLHYLPLHFTTLHYTTLHYNYDYTTTLHYTKLHYTTLHYTTLHSTTLHYTTPHYTTLHYTEWHCTTDRQVDR